MTDDDPRDVEERAAIRLEEAELVGARPIRALVHETVRGPRLRLYIALAGGRRREPNGEPSAAHTYAERDGWPRRASGYVYDVRDVDQVLDRAFAEIERRGRA